MNGKQVKLLRGQIRNVVKELFPEVMTLEMAETVRKELSKRIDEHFDILSKQVKTSLEEINDRTKKTQDFLVRATTPNSAPIKPLPETEPVRQE